MKFGLMVLALLSILLLGSSLAQAGDEPCEVNLLQPKIKAAIISDEHHPSSQLTVAEVKSRLQQNQQKITTDSNSAENKQQVTQITDEEKPDVTKDDDKPVKQPSRLGGIFDILLPATLRNPVK